MGRALAQRRETTQRQILAELARRERNGDFRRFNEFTRRHRIDSQQVRATTSENMPAPEGYEALLAEELETLFSLAGAGSADPYPLPLRADERAEQIFALQSQTMDMVRRREEVEAGELDLLRQQLAPHVLQGLAAAVSRCMDLRRIYFAPGRPRVFDNNRQTIQQFWGQHFQAATNDPRAYSSHLSGGGPSDPGALQREIATDAIDYALNSLQAGTISSGYYESTSGADLSSSEDEHPYGSNDNNGYGGGESSRQESSYRR